MPAHHQIKVHAPQQQKQQSRRSGLHGPQTTGLRRRSASILLVRQHLQRNSDGACLVQYYRVLRVLLEREELLLAPREPDGLTRCFANSNHHHTSHCGPASCLLSVVGYARCPLKFSRWDFVRDAVIPLCLTQKTRPDCVVSFTRHIRASATLQATAVCISATCAPALPAARASRLSLVSQTAVC